METLPETDGASREDRFVALARRVAAPMHRYAIRRTDPDTAQDVIADAMLVLWRRLEDVPLDDPLPWCYAVLRRCRANAERAARRQRRLVERLAAHRSPDPTRSPLLVDHDLDAALAQLSETDRELVRLWAWEELLPREIAVVLDITPNAASIRLHRARRKLAGLLGREHQPERKNVGRDGQEQVNERTRP